MQGNAAGKKKSPVLQFVGNNVVAIIFVVFGSGGIPAHRDGYIGLVPDRVDEPLLP